MNFANLLIMKQKKINSISVIFHSTIESFKKIFLRIKKFFSVTSMLGHEQLIVDSDEKFVNSNNALKSYSKKYYEITESSFEKFQLYIFDKYNIARAKFADESGSVESRIKLPLKFGIILGALFFVFVFGWMALAKIEGAAVAPGEIAFASSKQNIQSLSGGIVKNVFIKDGDFVLKGQALVSLKETDIKSAYNSLRNQLYALKISEERLIAEKNDYQN